jgi:hypothetical protein
MDFVNIYFARGTYALVTSLDLSKVNNVVISGRGLLEVIHVCFECNLTYLYQLFQCLFHGLFTQIGQISFCLRAKVCVNANNAISNCE